MIPSADKNLKTLLEKLEAQGWRIERTRKGFMCYPPDKSKQSVLIHGSESDHRAMKNTLARLKRNGYIQ